VNWHPESVLALLQCTGVCCCPVPQFHEYALQCARNVNASDAKSGVCGPFSSLRCACVCTYSSCITLCCRHFGGEAVRRPSDRTTSHTLYALAKTITILYNYLLSVGRAQSHRIVHRGTDSCLCSASPFLAPSNDILLRARKCPLHMLRAFVDQNESSLSDDSDSSRERVPENQRTASRLLARCMSRNQGRGEQKRGRERPISARARAHGQSVDGWTLGSRRRNKA
jgi:hypothetical protein